LARGFYRENAKTHDVGRTGAHPLKTAKDGAAILFLLSTKNHSEEKGWASPQPDLLE
jgi:hypothetical protein